MKTGAGERRKYTTITIPTRLFDNIQEKIKGTGFSSVSDYATYVLRETAAELSSAKASGKSAQGGVIQKLRALGYLE